MKALLDTHTFLWWITDQPRLPRGIRTIIENGENDLLVSAASGWEIMIKFQLGRLLLPEEPEDYLMDQIQQNAFQTLPIRLEHSLRLRRLPPLHKDPFDRMLIAQAHFENIPILTSDSLIARYPVEVVWS
jgi:PIN domain nuclease of toxin-antitoxin system